MKRMKRRTLVEFQLSPGHLEQAILLLFQKERPSTQDPEVVASTLLRVDQ